MNFHWSPLFNQLEIGVVLTDSRFGVLHANRAAGELFGKDILGMDFSTFFLNVEWFGEGFFKEEFSKKSIVTQVRVDESKVMTVKLHSEKVESEDQLIWTVTPIKTIDAKEDLPTRFASTHVGNWEYDVTKSILELDDVAKSIHGLRFKDQLTLDEAKQMYSFGNSKKQIFDSFSACLVQGKAFDSEFEILDAKGNHRWIRSTGKALRQADGLITKLYGTVQDITDVHEKSRIFESVSEFLPGFVIRYTSRNEGEEKVSFYGNKVPKYFSLYSDTVYDAHVFWSQMKDEDADMLKEKLQADTSDKATFFAEINLATHCNLRVFQTWWTLRSTKKRKVWEAVFLDFTDQMRARKQLLRSDERFQKLVSSMDDLIFTLDPEFRHTGIFGKSLEKTGLTEEFFLGKTAADIFGPDAASVHQIPNQKAFKGENVQYEWSVGSGHEQRWFLTRLVPMTEEDGSIFGIVGIATDITAKKKLEVEMSLANARYELVNKATNEAIYDWDLKNDALFWGGSFDRILGHNDHEGHIFSIKDWESWLYPEDLPRISASLEKFLNDPSKSQWVAQYRIKNHRRRYFYVLEMGYAVRNSQGEVVRMIGSIRDVNHEVILKNRLKSSYQRLSEFRKALDQSTNIILTDLDGIILDANQSTVELSGYSKEELIGSHTRVNRSGYHPKEFYQTMWNTIKAGKEWKGELKNRRKDGSHYWVFTTIFPLKDKFGNVYRFLAVRTDITEQKEAQEKIFQSFEKIKASEKKYSDLFHFSPLPMWVFDLDTLRVLDVNEAALTNYGYDRDEFVGISIFDFRPEDQVGTMKEFLEKNPGNFTVSKEKFIHQKKSGEQMIVEIFSIPIEFEGKLAQLVLANDVTTTVRYLEKVEAQNKILKDIAWTQSHIVRAPLARLMGIVQLIKDGILDLDELNQYLGLLDSSALELDQVIREISEKANKLEN